MNLSIAQLQIVIITAPALMALLLVPGLTLSHPLLVAQNTVPASVRSAIEPTQASSVRHDTAPMTAIAAGRPEFGPSDVPQIAFDSLSAPIGDRYSSYVSLGQPCRAP